MGLTTGQQIKAMEKSLINEINVYVLSVGLKLLMMMRKLRILV